MIDLYTWTTPNGRKISILLEELGLEYSVHSINIMEGDQNAEEFLKISPNNKIPAIVDQETGITLMESGAIMLYLAEKTGKFMPTNVKERWEVTEWLMWQMGGFGPMLGQVHHFTKFNPGKAPYAQDRFLAEANRIYGVLDRRLDAQDYIVGNEYSIADMAVWPWVSRFEWQTIDLDKFPNVKRWYTLIAARPAVQKGYHVPKFTQDIPIPE
ncbi:MAG: glutathione S-transferase N-terminal domain-containing protein [Sneathiella sp.]|nr:glutathione S-transferase N-terminal domain-containing protein [Sneathiella sp.]